MTELWFSGVWRLSQHAHPSSTIRGTSTCPHPQPGKHTLTSCHHLGKLSDLCEPEPPGQLVPQSPEAGGQQSSQRFTVRHLQGPQAQEGGGGERSQRSAATPQQPHSKEPHACHRPPLHPPVPVPPPEPAQTAGAEDSYVIRT